MYRYVIVTSAALSLLLLLIPQLSYSGPIGPWRSHCTTALGHDCDTFLPTVGQHDLCDRPDGTIGFLHYFDSNGNMMHDEGKERTKCFPKKVGEPPAS